jgi:hypothetical protein
MPSFENLFLESKGRPVVYNEQTIQLGDDLSLYDGQQFSELRGQTPILTPHAEFDPSL